MQSTSQHMHTAIAFNERLRRDGLRLIAGIRESSKAPVICDDVVCMRGDTVTLNGQLTWEISWSAETLKSEDLRPGFRLEIPTGYVENAACTRHTCFYFTSHEDTDDNVIEVVATDGDRLKMRLRGNTDDVNFYDNSKPRTVITLETWFAHNPAGRRTFD